MIIRIAALALIGVGSASFAQEARIGSTSINLTAPRDQCALSNEKGEEARVVANLRELLAGRNQLLATYADCGELAQFRSGKLEGFDNFATYVTPTDILNAVVPADVLRKVCTGMRAKTDLDLAAIVQNRSVDMERLFQGVKINEIKFLGVLAEEPSICYTGQVQKLARASGVEKVQIAISTTLWLKQKLITYNLNAPYRSSDTISNLLSKHILNVTTLIAANQK
jgi:hypothetical protein